MPKVVETKMIKMSEVTVCPLPKPSFKIFSLEPSYNTFNFEPSFVNTPADCRHIRVTNELGYIKGRIEGALGITIVQSTKIVTDTSRWDLLIVL